MVTIMSLTFCFKTLLMIFAYLRASAVTSKGTVNVTYMFVNQLPYENIVNETWKFTYGSKDEQSKSLHGIISRSLNYIIGKHCPHYKLQPTQRFSLQDMLDFLMVSNNTASGSSNQTTEHVIVGPLPMQVDLYYNMHYKPTLFSWQKIVDSKGIILIRRLDSVDLSKRILRAIGKSKLLLCFVAFLTCIIAVFLWVFDRDWSRLTERDKERSACNMCYRILHQMYWALITTVSVGPADSGPKTSIGKIVGLLWLMVSLVTVSCMTSIITSDMVDSHVKLENKTVGFVRGSWEEMIGRMLINHQRSKKNTVQFSSYMELLDGIQKHPDIYGGLIDYSVAAVLQKAMRDRDLGEHHCLGHVKKYFFLSQHALLLTVHQEKILLFILGAIHIVRTH